MTEILLILAGANCLKVTDFSIFHQVFQFMESWVGVTVSYGNANPEAYGLFCFCSTFFANFKLIFFEKYFTFEQPLRTIDFFTFSSFEIFFYSFSH